MWCSAIGCIVTLILSLLTVPPAADAQQPAKIPRVGWLDLTFRTPSDTDPRIFQGAFLAQQCPAVLCFRRMRGDEPSAFPPGE